MKEEKSLLKLEMLAKSVVADVEENKIVIEAVDGTATAFLFDWICDELDCHGDDDEPESDNEEEEDKKIAELKELASALSMASEQILGELNAKKGKFAGTR